MLIYHTYFIKQQQLAPRPLQFPIHSYLEKKELDTASTSKRANIFLAEKRE